MRSDIPSYRALADSLQNVVEGARPGDRLASENELAALHDVSRLTARAAVQELERRHLVRRVRGSGTFVARRIDYAIRADMPPSWSETVRRSGGDPYRAILGIGAVRAPSQVRDALDLPSGARVAAVSRLGHVDELVADVSTSWVPLDLARTASLLHDGLGDGGSLYTALAAAGVRPRRRWTTAQLDTVPDEVAATLELEGRPLVWRIESCNEDAATGRPIELAQAWMRPDVYRVTLHLRGDT